MMESTCTKWNISKLVFYWKFKDSLSLEKSFITSGLWTTLHKDKNFIHIQNSASSDKREMPKL